MANPFHIMAKPVCGVCNLACGYCYYRHKPRELYPQETRFQMSPEVLESFIRQSMEAQPQRCEFGWQGGEPLLAGREFFQRAVELQQRFGRPGQTVANAIQTNGTLLDDAWCEFLASRKFLVGVSLDGPPQWHDAFRRDEAGNPSHHRAWAGVELLRKHGVEFNVLVTLHAASAPHAADLYRYFVNRGVQYLQFIPILERGDAASGDATPFPAASGDATLFPAAGIRVVSPLPPERKPDGAKGGLDAPDGAPQAFSCTPEQYGRFLVEVFEQWRSRDVGKVSERFIDGVIHRILFGAAASCCQAERCASAFVLEYNGDLYACDHFVYERWRVGNILQTPLVDLVRSPLLEEFARLKTELPSACRACEFLEFCNGGCPKHHVPLYGGGDRVNYFCESYKTFFRAALPELRCVAEDFRQAAQRADEQDWREAQARTSARLEPDEIVPPDYAVPVQPTPPASSAPIAPAASTAPLPSPPATTPLPRPNIPIARAGRNDPCPCGSGRKFKSCCGRGQ